MTVYRVMIAGEGLRLNLDGEEADCGFYKNEYVWARDKSNAIARARKRLWNDLKNNVAVINDLENMDPSDMDLRVEEVEAGLSILELRKRQGFVFYRADAPMEK